MKKDKKGAYKKGSRANWDQQYRNYVKNVVTKAKDDILYHKKIYEDDMKKIEEMDEDEIDAMYGIDWTDTPGGETQGETPGEQSMTKRGDT